MSWVAERLLARYRAALDQAVGVAVASVPAGHVRRALLRIGLRARERGDVERLKRLQRLAVLAEARGLLEPEHVIAIRRLAYRVEWLVRRAGTPSEGREQ
jgi:hypothetical protein